MAEIATIAGVTITVPGILSGAWKILKAAYDLYGSVDMRREQIDILLNRCRDLICNIAEQLKPDPDISDGLRSGVDYTESVCQSVKDIVETIQRKGFLWCMVNADKIDLKVKDAENRIADAFRMFNLFAEFDRAKFQAQMIRAREQDQSELSAHLRQLSDNDQTILRAIQDQSGVHRRMEELLFSISKHVRSLRRESDKRPEEAFLRSAAGALQRVSNTSGDYLPPDWVISSLEVNFDENSTIGQGSFGRIYKGDWNGAIVAIKQMYCEDARTLCGVDRKTMYKEVKIWSNLRHPHVLSLYGACLEATTPFLVMQHCQFGNICHYLEKHPDANRVNLSYDVVLGLCYLHGRGIVHSDVKGVNVLVSDDQRALLTDFGLSLALDDLRSRSALSTNANAPRGTLRWMAPECLDGARPDKAADIYSLGVTIWEIFSGKIPFVDVPERSLPRVVVDRQQRPARPDRLFDDGIWETIQRCWAPEAASRPSATDVQQSLNPSAVAKSLSFEPTVPSLPLWATAADVRARARDPDIGSTRNTESEWVKLVRTNSATWKRGNPKVYFDHVTLPGVPTDKAYQYRVVKGDLDLGTRPTYELNKDGSQTINLLEYNKGYGIHEETPINVFVVDPEDGMETLVAEWKPKSRRPPKTSE